MDWDKEPSYGKNTLGLTASAALITSLAFQIKDNKEYPLFDYEKILYDTLMSDDGSFKDKHLWVLKATGLRCYRVHVKNDGLAMHKR